MLPLERRVLRRIRAVRLQRGLTQTALAKRAGLARAHVTRLEAGRHEMSLATLIRLARGLKVAPSDLLLEGK